MSFNIKDSVFLYSYFLRGCGLAALLLGLMIVFHESGHYLWDITVTKVPSKIVFTKVNGRWAFGVQATLPKERYWDVRNNPDKYIRDRKLSRFVSIISIIPAIVFRMIFPEYELLFIVLILCFILYTFWETFSYHKEHPWITLVKVKCDD